jgi:hypothetical protein
MGGFCVSGQRGLIVAEGTGNDHKSVIQLVRTYADDLREFGEVAFEMLVVERGQLGGRQPEIALLNEDQATLPPASQGVSRQKETPPGDGVQERVGHGVPTWIQYSPPGELRNA